MAGDLASDKRRLREGMASRRRAIAPEAARSAAESATRLLLEVLELLKPARVGLYAALPDELETRQVFDALVWLGTPRLFPRPLPDGRLAFVAAESWEDLGPGRFGVLEPHQGPDVRLDAGDAVIVPGVAFDPAGRRLGRGRAYYDRTFPPQTAPSPTLIGFGYELQVVDEVPHDSRDRRMDAIVTERCVRWMRPMEREPA